MRDLAAGLSRCLSARDMQARSLVLDAFLDAADLACALADTSEADGALARDEDKPAHALALTLALALARAYRNFGSSDRRDLRHALELSHLLARRADQLPPSLPSRTMEAFAYYAAHPAFHLIAAEQAHLPAGTVVIGLRSTGLALAAMVAAAIDSPLLLTIRPGGPPFERRVRLSHRQTGTMRGAPAIAIVDEGPGLSGSSFGGTVDALAASGIPAERIHLFPTHKNGPGHAALIRHRQIWTDMRVRVVTLDDEAARRVLDVATLFGDITGPLTAPVRDISAGGWRTLSGWAQCARPPVSIFMERRKFLLESARGRFLLKFEGLGRFGRELENIAEQLARKGFIPPSLGLRDGFMLSPWFDAGVPGAALRCRAQFLTHLAAYLSERAHMKVPALASGASAETLRAMVSRNVSLAFSAEEAQLLLARLEEIDPSANEWLPMPIDGRLHAWEWIVAPGNRILKCDALDHHASHDLIGLQDITYDIAGAIVEFQMTADEIKALRSRLEHACRRILGAENIRFHIFTYAAFQVGLWSLSRDTTNDPDEQRLCQKRVEFYKDRLRARASPASSKRNEVSTLGVEPA